MFFFFFFENPIRGDPEEGDVDLVIIKISTPKVPVLGELLFGVSMTLLDSD